MTSRLPTAARKAVERAKKQAAAMRDPANTETTGDEATAPAPKDETAQDQSVTPAPTDAARHEAEPDDGKPKRIDPTDYLSRFTNFKNFHDEEVIRYRKAEEESAKREAELKTKAANLETQNTALVKEVADLKVELQRRESIPTVAPEPAKLEFSEEELAALGDEGANMVASIVSRMTPKQEMPQSTAAASQEPVLDAKTVKRNQDFFRGLTGLVPGWEEIEHAEGFNKWMYATDPRTGSTPDQSLQSAFHKGDYVSAASIYQDFLSAHGASLNKPTPDELVMPSGQAGDTNPDAPPEFSAAEFSEVKRQVMMLKTKIQSNRHKSSDVGKLNKLQVREEQLSRAIEQINKR